MGPTFRKLMWQWEKLEVAAMEIQQAPNTWNPSGTLLPFLGIGFFNIVYQQGKRAPLLS